MTTSPTFPGLMLKSLLENEDVLQNLNAINRAAATGKEEGKKDGEDSWGMLDAQAAFLGPTLWDKTLLYDADMKCEFMDLDEFLMENGIPVHENATANSRNPPSLTSPAASPASSHGNALLSPGSSNSGNSAILHSPVTPASYTPFVPAANPVSSNSGRDSPSYDDGDSDFSQISMASSYDCDPVAKRRKNVKGRSKESGKAMDSVPGHDFDPKARTFTDDELKPQPMSKKSRKQLVPDDRKDDRYWARRRKNNMAAKRSRDARRLKENQIAMRASFLERENTVLKMELERMRKDNEMLRERLTKKK